MNEKVPVVIIAMILAVVVVYTMCAPPAPDQHPTLGTLKQDVRWWKGGEFQGFLKAGTKVRLSAPNDDPALAEWEIIEGPNKGQVIHGGGDIEVGKK
jgi:hypothetical protein